MTRVCHHRALAARALLGAALTATLARGAEPAPASAATGAGQAAAAPAAALPAAAPSAVSPARPGALPAAAAVVPGALLHGAGHYAAGDGATAKKLLKYEGLGLGTLLVSGSALVVSGASRRFVGLATSGVVLGFGLFAITALADLYGASGLGGGQAVTRAPVLESSMGVLHAYDPKFSYRWFLDQGLQARLGSWKLGAGASTSLGDRNGLLRLNGGHRLRGPGTDAAAPDNSFLDVNAGASRHHYGPERLAIWTAEISLDGRLDLARVGPSLRGSFAELSLGRAIQVYEYKVRDAAADYNELLLARFGFGWYFGAPGQTSGEVYFGYDHRHDGFAAGLLMRGLGSGVAGHFEARGRVFRGSWGLGAGFQVGSAYVSTLSLLHRHGGPW